MLSTALPNTPLTDLFSDIYDIWEGNNGRWVKQGAQFPRMMTSHTVTIIEESYEISMGKFSLFSYCIDLWQYSTEGCAITK